MRLNPSLATLPVALGLTMPFICVSDHADARADSIVPLTCRYTPGEHFQLRTFFTFDQVVTSPDTVIAGQSGRAHIHYTISGSMIFLVKSVDSSGMATAQLVREGSEAFYLDNGRQSGSNIAPSSTTIRLTPDCSATSGIAASMSTSLTFLTALPRGPLHRGKSWTARVRGTALGADSRPYALSLKEALQRTLIVPDGMPGGTPAAAVSISARARGTDVETSGARTLRGQAIITVAGTGTISTALHRVVGVALTTTQAVHGSVARPFLPTVPYSVSQSVTFTAIDITTS